MAVSVDNRPSRTRSVLTAILTLLILIPAGVLFLRVWQQNEDQRDSSRLEQQGVQYLTALAPLVSALAEAQSSALQGVSTAPASLTTAVARVAAVDQRVGERLGTRDRWNGLREKIGALPAVTGNSVQIFQAHVEVTDLSLALYRAVLDNSTLTRDPDNDLSHLQQALGIDMPNAVVQVSRMGDLSLMLANLRGSAAQRAQAQALLAPQFGSAVSQVNNSVNSLTDNLQSAVDDTQSTTLSGSLVSTVDGFRRGVESFVRGASAAPGGSSAPNAAAMATAQSQLQTSLGSLSAVLVREMNGLLERRIDRLDNRRLEALAMAVLVLLLTLAAVILPLTGRRRRPAGADKTSGLSVGSDEDTFGNLKKDSVPAYGDEVYPTRRERSGALR